MLNRGELIMAFINEAERQNPKMRVGVKLRKAVSKAVDLIITEQTDFHPKDDSEFHRVSQ